MYPGTSKHKMVIQCGRKCDNFAALLKNIPVCLTRTLTTTYASEMFFIYQRQGNLQGSFVSFRALAMYMNGHNDLDSHTSRYFTDFISKSGSEPKIFRGVSLEDLPVFEEIVQRNIFNYDFDIQEGEYVKELARRSIGRFDKTVKLLKFKNHIVHTNDFNCFRCPCCDTFFNKSDNFNKHLLRCKDRVRHIYPKNV